MSDIQAARKAHKKKRSHTPIKIWALVKQEKKTNKDQTRLLTEQKLTHVDLAQQVNPTDAQPSDESNFKNKTTLRQHKPFKKLRRLR